MTRSHVAAVALLLATGLCACGVITQDKPEPLELPASVSTSPTKAPDDGETTPARRSIYLIRDARLVAVPRTAGGPGTAVAALLAGPNNAEIAAGTRTAIPAGTKSIEVQTDGTLAVLRLPVEFAELDGNEQILAIAQLVYTVTERTGIVRVRLMNGDRALNAPTASGHLVSRPVGRGDYETLSPT